MTRKTEKPVITAGDGRLSDSVATHPAFAMIGASHVTGGGHHLFGSDFRHGNFVTITIRRAELHRGLSNDRPTARDELIEVAVSEAQWATFISTLNHGFGVPCTLQHFDRKEVPGIEPMEESRQDQFGRELAERLREAERQAAILADLVEKGGKKTDMRNALIHLRNNLSPNVEFIAKQFGEHMEKVSEHAKIEIEAYLGAAVTHAGLQVLRAESAPISLPARKEDKP